jgi:phasin family protein
MAGEQGKSKTIAAKPAAKPVAVKAPSSRPVATAPVPVAAAKPAPKRAAPKLAVAAPIQKPIQKRVKAAIKTAPVSAPAAPVASAPVVTPTVASAPVGAPPVVAASVASAPVASPIPEITPPIPQKDKIMDMTSSFPNNFQNVIADAQDKAKEAFEKSSAALGEAGEFARGNVEAIVESGKILASGLQDFGSSFAAEGRSAFETMTADLKELAAAKTPADFLKIQSELVRKSFDGAVAYGSKNSEAVLKLATDTFAPITGRVSLAVEKARTTASL